MRNQILKSKHAVSLIGLAMLTACAVGSKKDQANYRSQIAKTNSYLEQYSTLLVQNQKSDENLRETARLMALLDDHAATCRKDVKDLRAQLATASADTIRTQLGSLEEHVKSALQEIGRIEQQFSQKNASQLVANTPELFEPRSVANVQSKIKLQADVLSSLAGLRDLFLGSYNDLVGSANFRLNQLNAAPYTENLRASPIMNSYADGGKIRGVVNDSVTGNVISGATVGFKTMRESRDYFYETATDNLGRYESPYLAAGTYYIDIRRDGYVLADSQSVRASNGVNNEGNTVSLTAPLAEGKFRIVLTWTNEALAGVRDVDSYLLIPGETRPLNFNRTRTDVAGSYLDRDDTDWEGPETTTIHTVRHGTYRYYVNNYNRRQDEEALGNSKVRIAVYKGSAMVREYTVPVGRGLSYEVFQIRDGQIVDIQKFDSLKQLPTS